MNFQKDRIPMQYLFKANQLYRKKDYNESLTYYNKALTSLKISIDHPLPNQRGIGTLVLSLRGLNYYSLRDYEKAERDFDSIIKVRPTDTTTLHRRATMYLKIKAYEKAGKDIAKLFQIEPDSIRVAALVMEIKQKSEDIWKQELKRLYNFEDELKDLEDNELLQQQQEDVNFSNLKKLQRVVPKRVSVKQKVMKPRISLVEFKQDQFITYELDEIQREKQKDNKEQYSSTKIKETLEIQNKELEYAGKENQDSNIILVEKKQRKIKKSILKCSIMQSIPTQKQSSFLSVEPIDVSKILDIDGKPLKRKSSEVKFRASLVEQEQHDVFDSKKLKQKMKRKSSIKHGIQPYVLQQPSEVENRGFGRASFMGLKNTDGKFIRKSQVKQSKKQSVESGSSDGEEYNIYGKDEIQNIDLQIKQVFGSFTQSNKGSAVSGGPKKSILKIMEPIKQPEGGSVLKPKKSVLFR